MQIVHIIELSLCLDMGIYTYLDMMGLCTFNMGLYISRTGMMLDDDRVGRYDGDILAWMVSEELVWVYVLGYNTCVLCIWVWYMDMIHIYTQG